MHAKLSAVIIALGIWAAVHSPAREAPPVPEGLETQLEQFFTDKQVQARALVKDEKREGMPQMWEFFTAGENGDWAAVTNLYSKLRGQGGTRDPRLQSMAWQPVMECFYAYDFAAHMDEKYVLDFARGVLNSMPRGGIYFSGNDAGRWLPTAFSKSHAKADLCFIIMQNGLMDGFFLKYLRSMYGEQIKIPSDEESKAITQEYLDDAQRRQKEGKLNIGEEVKVVDGKLQPVSHISLMAINALLAKRIFEANPDKEFFIAESFPLDWMYPHLTPNGLIMKINRKPLDEIPDEAVKRDQTYWTRFINGALDKWLAQTTSVETVCDFARRVFDQKEPAPFKPDENFVNSTYACRSYSKARNSIARLYAWRARQSHLPAEKQRMEKAADFAYRQAFVLSPSNTETVYSYIALLAEQKRIEDARRIVKVAQILDPKSGNYPAVLRELDRIEAQAEKKP